MSETKVVRFGAETWSKGTRGVAGPANSDRAVIQNLQQWDDGSLGPSWLWFVVNTLDPAKFDISTRVFPATHWMPVSETYVQGYVAISGTDWEFYQWGSTTRYAWKSTGAAILSNANANTSLYRIDASNFLLGPYLIFVGGVYGVSSEVQVTDVQIAAKARFSTPDNIVLEGSTIHQGRAFYYGFVNSVTTGRSLQNRVWYSDDISTAVDAYAVFSSASQTFDIDGDIDGVVGVGANLFIWTLQGDWYMLQGRGDPKDGTLTPLGKGRVPAANTQPVQFDRTAIFLNSDRSGISVITEGGEVDDASLGHLGASFEDSGDNSWWANPTVNSTNNTAIVPWGGKYAFTLRNGTWVYETWDMPESSTPTQDHLQLHTDHRPSYSSEMMAKWLDGTTNEWRIYRRVDYYERPNRSSFYAFANSEDGKIALPRLYDATKQVRVRRVLIDGRTWTSTNNLFESAVMTVTVEDGKTNSADLTLGPASQLLSAVPDEETPIRITATPSSVLPYTHFSDITLHGMQGMAFDAVTVELELSQGPVQ